MDSRAKDTCTDALKLIFTSNRGELFIKNLSNDLSRGRIEFSTAKAFFTALANTLCAKPAPMCLSAIQTVLLNDPSFLHCGPIHDEDLGEVYTTVALEALERYYLDPVIIAGRPPGLSSAAFFAWLGAAKIPHILRDTTIRGEREIVWLAPWSDNIKAFRSTTRTPDTLRSFLGLNHFSRDEFLVTLHFEGLQSSFSLKRPTSLDAGPNLIFRSDRSSKTYGYAVHLLTNGKGSRELVGRDISSRTVTRAMGWGELTSTPAIDWTNISAAASGNLKSVLTFIDNLA